jgi:hypothetical protein
MVALRGAGVFGLASYTGSAPDAYGVYGQTDSTSGVGVYGLASSSSAAGYGVKATTYGSEGAGLAAIGASGPTANTDGLYAVTNGSAGYAGYFNGRIFVSGTVAEAGGGFRIDHPLDPEGKYLSHSFVESPEMKNVYDGVITTDAKGFATVEMPEWFEALNRDLRYQLTVIGDGAWARARVYRELDHNRFVVQTDVPATKVSWLVTGIRRDRYADTKRIRVEEEKPEAERGTYLHPEAWGQPKEKAAAEKRHPWPASTVAERTAP